MNFPSPSFAFIEGLGGPEVLLVLFLVLLLFGGQKLPEFAKGLGKSIREFKRAASDVEHEIKRAIDEAPETPAKPTPLPTIAPPHDKPAAPPPPPSTDAPPS
jgi:TatA/E family protein of Tat protein translocase